jgi:negative regulator of sigma E activity
MENQPANSSEKLWRKLPEGAEREALRREPDMEAEARLTAALGKLADAPVATNFTSRVLAAVELEDRQAARATRRRWNWRLLLPRVAMATAVIAFIGIGFQRYSADQHRQEIAKSLAMVASAHTLPSVDALENLEAIERMSQSSHADGELLAALQ